MEAEHGQKKVRKRQKQLCKQIKAQMEFYFSDANLLKDRFVRKLMDETEDKWISLEVFKDFNKLRSLTTDMTLVAKAISSSDLIEVNEAKDKVRRTKPIADPGDLDARTVYVENLPASVNHDWVRNVFSAYGTVTYVSLPRFKSTGDFKGFGFVEFQDEEEAKRAVRECVSPAVDTSKRPGIFPVASKQMKQVIKQAVAHNIPVPSSGHTAEKDAPQEEEEEEKEQHSKKREHSEEKEEVVVRKKQKTEGKEAKKEVSEKEKEDGGEKKLTGKGVKRKNEEELEKSAQKKRRQEEEKAAKKSRKKKKKDDSDDEPQLRVISKAEWLSLRKEYLEQQKANMSKLKESLKKVTIQNQTTPKKEAMDTSHTSGTSEKGKRTLEFTPDVLFEVTSKLPMARKTLKEALSGHGEVTYIDLVDGECEAVVRCPSADSATSITAASIDSYKCRMLKGDEEKQYWDKIMADREKRLNSKQHKKIRGKDKVINKAHQTAPESQQKKHVIFDDS